MVDQARQASDRLIDAEQMKASTIQEAAYYRTKLAALESSNETDALHLERERISDLERHVSPDERTLDTGSEDERTQR
jgi:hypothetical protein